MTEHRKIFEPDGDFVFSTVHIYSVPEKDCVRRTFHMYKNGIFAAIGGPMDIYSNQVISTDGWSTSGLPSIATDPDRIGVRRRAG